MLRSVLLTTARQMAPLTSEPQEMPERPGVLADDALWELFRESVDADEAKRPSFPALSQRLGGIIEARRGGGGGSANAGWL